MDRLNEIEARAEAATPGPWVAVDIKAAAMAGSSYCSGCYVLEVDPHDEGDGWAKPHGPDCSCDNPAWVPLADAERWDAVTPKIGPLVTVEDPLSLTAELEAKDAEIERLRAALETIVFLSPSAVGADGAYRLGRVAQKIAREALADQNGESTADYIRSEAERLPNGTAARFLAALDAMDGATEPGQPGSAYPRDGRAEMKAKIKPTTIDDTEVSGVILTITADKFGSKITVESLALPHLNRDFYFTADGRFDGTGTMVSSGSDDGLGETGEPG